MNRLVVRFALIAIVLFSAPFTTYASNPTFLGPIVPPECHCENQPNPDGGAAITTAPDFGCVMQTVQNVVNFAITLSTILFTIYLVITGFAFMTSGSSGEAIAQARTRFTNVFIGLAVLLCSWLIIDYVMKTIYDQGSFGPWNSILGAGTTDENRCIVAKSPSAITTGSVLVDVTSVSLGTSTGGGSSGGNCTAIPDSQLTTVDGFKLTTDTARRFSAMKAAAAKDKVSLVISSGYRSPDGQLAAWNQNGCNLVNGKAVCAVRTAAVPCSLGGGGSNHTRGTAVDIRLTAGVYAWLQKNAAQYGFYNKLPNDLPHWSDTGR